MLNENGVTTLGIFSHLNQTHLSGFKIPTVPSLALLSAVSGLTTAEMKAEETKDQKILEEEHRWDGDTAYVKQQFVYHYGGEKEWNAAVKVLPGELDHEEEHYFEKKKAHAEEKKTAPAPVPIQKQGSFFGAQTYNDTTTVATAPLEPHSFFGAQNYNDGTNPKTASSNVSSPGANLFGAALGSNSTSSSSSSSSSAFSFLNEYSQEKKTTEIGATHHHRSLFSDPEEEDDMFGALGGGSSSKSSSNSSSTKNNQRHSIFSDPEEEDDMFGALGGGSSASSKARKGSFFGAQTYNDAPKSNSFGNGGTGSAGSSGGTTSTHTSRTPSFFGTVDNGGLGGMSTSYC